MKKRPIKDVAHSVHQRLLNLARQTDRSFNDLVLYYAIERWLFRLSRHQYSDRFVLKGALMLLVWDTPVMRPTRDVDLLGRVSNDPESIRRIVSQVCREPVDDDGLCFDPDSVATSPIAEDAEYTGVRAKFSATLGTNRIAMQVDFGFSDSVSPPPVEVLYPTLLDHPRPRILAYHRETAIAEKLDAMVTLGELNSRMKDFFDIALLAGSFDFDGRVLADAVKATFSRRDTAVDPNPVCFSDEFARDPSKHIQWKAFIRRSRITDGPAEFQNALVSVREFLQPLVRSLANADAFDSRWLAGGPWRP